MYVSSVEKLLALLVTSKHMKECTLERSPLHVSNVGKPSIHPVPLGPMNKVIVVRNLVDVSNVEKLLVLKVTLKHMKEFTLE
jgi:hypothetical protein